jgi:hypothetical protein
MFSSSASRPTLLIAVALIVLTGLIHVVEAPEYLEEEVYVGVLFILNALGAAASAYGLLHGAPRWAWLLGVLVAGGAFVAFILSRTTGLPSFKQDEWEGLGLVSLVVEGAFVALALTAMSRRAPGRVATAQR